MQREFIGTVKSYYKKLLLPFTLDEYWMQLIRKLLKCAILKEIPTTKKKNMNSEQTEKLTEWCWLTNNMNIMKIIELTNRARINSSITINFEISTTKPVIISFKYLHQRISIIIHRNFN